MAFLNTLSHRPSCIVSGLPKRFRESLKEDLGSTVALSTCPVEQLESAVNLRGASIAIVGASDDSLEIAERLSHRKTPIKVFLVHYRDIMAPPTEVNGFAGVFDLRFDHSNLKRSIQRLVSQPIRIEDSRTKKGGYREALRYLISMQERMGNRPALMETILEGFLELAGTASGLLLMRDEVSPHILKVAAVRGGNLPERDIQIDLGSSVLRQLSAGETCVEPAGISYKTDLPWGEKTQLSFAFPINEGSTMAGCFLASEGQDREELNQYSIGVASLLRQIKVKDASQKKADLLSEVRRLISPGWVLADPSGRTLYREGELPSEIFDCEMKIKSPRLRDAINQARSGKLGNIQLDQGCFSYRALSWEGRSHVILKMEGTLPLRDEVRTKESVRLSDLRQLLKPLFEESVLESLVEDFETPSEKSRIKPDQLAALGLLLGLGYKELPVKVRSRVVLVGAIFCAVTGCEATVSVKLEPETLTQTLEVGEGSLAKRPEWLQQVGEDSLVCLMTNAVFPGSQWKFGAYGGQFTAPFRS